MRKQKKFTQGKKFMPRADRPKDRQAKEHERMAEALAAYQGPITKCPPGSASNRVAKSRPTRPS
jgi:hypothetical protein